MNYSASNKIVFAHILFLIAANILAANIRFDKCSTDFAPGLAGPTIAYIEFILLVVVGLISFTIKPFRKFILPYYGSFWLGLSTNLVLMIPTCLVIQGKNGIVFGAFNSADCQLENPNATNETQNH